MKKMGELSFKFLNKMKISIWLLSKRYIQTFKTCIKRNTHFYSRLFIALVSFMKQ